LELTDFERKVLAYLISGEVDAAVLKKQLESATVSERDFTGPGVFVILEVASEAPRLVAGRLHFIQGNPHVVLKHPQLEYDAMAVLFIQEGVIQCLEMVSYAQENWPANEDLFEVQYREKDQTWQ
jgi:hypothetical protein